MLSQFHPAGWILALLATASCAAPASDDDRDGGGRDAPDGPGPYAVTGAAFDTVGRPLPGADVEIHSTVYVASVKTTTGPDGRYHAEIPDGSWRVLGSVLVPYDGKQYCVTLEPETREAFWAADGAVRDLYMRIQGPGPEPDSDPYGGKLEVVLRLGDLPDGIQLGLGVVLEPDGPLLDGTTGALLERTQVVVTGEPGWDRVVFDDLPLGRYRMYAGITDDGSTWYELDARVASSASSHYGTDVVAFDGGFLTCRSPYYVTVEVMP